MESELVKIIKLRSATEWTRWKFQVKVLLNASELFDVVNGENPKPILAAQGQGPAYDAALLSHQEKLKA